LVDWHEDAGKVDGTSCEFGWEGDQAMRRSSCWIVIAAFNEGSRLATTLQRLGGSGQDYTIVVVDDGSSDDTASVAGRFPVWVLRHPVNCGQGAALQTGIEFALRNQAEAIVTFDADGQHLPSDIPQLLAPIDSRQADVVLGSRFRGSAINMPWRRKLLLKAAVLFTRVTARIRVTDAHNGLRAFSRAAAEQIKIRQPRMAHASEILEQISYHRLRYTEVPVTIRYTKETLQKGQSAWGAFRITSHLMLGRLMKMNWFQTIFVPILTIFLLLEIVGFWNGRLSRSVRLLRSGLWLAAITLILMPELSSHVAQWFGIGRGTDLVLYLFMLATVVAWLHLQTQHHRLERLIVDLARAEALRTPVSGPVAK
jgi:polyprenyl-phospho-N-acetylgalactosaminyl synthase